MSLRFSVDSQSTYPVHSQLKEQVKLALAFGELRAGDTLPSIREVAQELGIGPGVVRRAYSELARVGILSVSRSRRVLVNRELQYKRESESLGEDTRRLASQVLDKLLALGIHPQSFAQFFQHWLVETRRCEALVVFTECNPLQARQYAEEVAQSWGVPVQGLDFDDLRQMSREELARTRHMITIPYHYEEAREIARGAGKNLVTVSVHWHPEVLKQVTELGPKGRIAFVFQRVDEESYGRLLVRELEGLLASGTQTFGCLALEEIEPVEDWLKKKDWHLVYFSNRIWDRLSEKVRSCPKAATPRLALDPVSLERARIEIGVLS